MMTPAGQRWTRSKPTEPGWYWWRDHVHGIPTMIEVEGDGSDVEPLIVRWDCADDEPVEQMDGEWQGPLSPNEATE